jgi:hypothetical protein
MATTKALKKPQKQNKVNIAKEILLELARIIHEKYNCPIILQDDEPLTLRHYPPNGSYEYGIGVTPTKITVSSAEKSLFDSVGIEPPKTFELMDPKCFDKFREWIPGTKIPNTTYDIYTLPDWAISYIDRLISNTTTHLVRCPICGEPHNDGYICDCGIDASAVTVLYPYIKYEDMTYSCMEKDK